MFQSAPARSGRLCVGTRFRPVFLVSIRARAKRATWWFDAPQTNEQDYNAAKNMTDIGRKLLQSIGFREPDDASIREAIEANDVFIDTLQAIHQRAQALTVEAQS